MFIMTDPKVGLELVRHSPIEWAKLKVRAVESIKLTRDHV